MIRRITDVRFPPIADIREQQLNPTVRLLALICVGLAGLCLVFGFMWRASEHRLTKMASEVHRAEDAPFEQQAISLKAAFEHVPPEKIADLMLPITIHFLDRRCVELRPKWGVVGGIDVYCFDSRTRRLIEHQSIGQ